MPIKIPNDLPASKILKEENIFVMDETRALSQRIRPLKLIIVNIMPTKMLVFIKILLVIKFPIITPIKGIMKWYTPTINDNNSLSFFVIPCVPYISANEKASIDRLTAIKNIVIIFNLITYLNICIDF